MHCRDNLRRRRRNFLPCMMTSMRHVACPPDLLLPIAEWVMMVIIMHVLQAQACIAEYQQQQGPEQGAAADNADSNLQQVNIRIAISV